MKMRKEYLDDPSHAEILEEIESMKKPIRKELTKEFRSVYSVPEDRLLFYPLGFFFLYFDGNGDLLKRKEGFSGAIGNPPWNNLKSNARGTTINQP